VTVFLVALTLPWRILFDVVTWAALLVGILSVILAIAQVFGGRYAALYLYELTLKGSPVGLFANINHQATFLLMCLPFVAVLGAKAHSRWQQEGSGVELLVLFGGLAFMLLAGIAIDGSLAGYLLAPFVVAGSAVLLSGESARQGARYLAAGLVLTIAALGVALISPRLQGLGESDYFGGERGRYAIHSHTLEAAVDFAPLGSGFGSFENVFPFYEDANATETTFVNHAHNEYLEILLELGLPGLGLVLVFLAWWTFATFKIWLKATEFGTFQLVKMAASLAIAVVLIHALVDYAIRTPAISSFVAACLAIMVRTRTSQPGRAEDASSDPDVGP
jgi:O-antigen ligase